MKKQTRNQRKKIFIQLKNQIREHGQYHTPYIHDDSMTWTDIYFLSNVHKNKIFSVTLETLEAYALTQDGMDVEKILDKLHPISDDVVNNMLIFEKIPGSKLVRARISEEYKKIHVGRNKIKEEILPKVAAEAKMISPQYKIVYRKPVIIGIDARVNASNITEEAILNFINHFRSLGEFMNDEIIWEGPPVKTVSANLL